ncbi:MAG: hypothetical protein JW741_19180, partial [Sedimentisphaerales bacterium]|nr:hypothetical protein [Sedimentisphaerales bacterium]
MQRITMFFMTCLVAAPFVGAQSIDLAGTWAFRLDSEDQGVEQQWFNEALTESIELPGVLQAQGYGNDVSTATEWIGTFKNSPWYSAERYEPYRQPGNVKFPYCLQPDKHYVGAAWYQKAVDIPADWAGRRITLTLQRPHWYTDVWVDGRHATRGDSLSVPHEYDLAEFLSPGRHTITLRVHNGLVINVGPNSHSVSDHTQSAWNGIAGKIELNAGSPVWIKNVQVYPRLDRQDARVIVSVENSTTTAVEGKLTFQAEAYNTDKSHAPAAIRAQVNVPAGETRTVEAVYPLGPDMLAWDEFSPVLYRLRVDLVEGNDTVSDTRAVTFGMREVSTRGTHVTVNGRAIYLRGTLECCIFPKTGYPPLDVASWKRIIRICKAHGLNHMRFHSWCPPEAAFVAADELGFYFHVEASSWANQSATIGDGGAFDAWIQAEADRILEARGNHASFIMMAYGNEPAGNNQRDFLGRLVDSWKQKDPRRLYTAGAGWPIIPENQFHSTPEPRVQRWGEGLKSRINGQPPATMADYRDFVRKHPDTPVVAHEIGQWCVYPNFDEMAKYTGYLKPKNFEVFQEFLEK